MTSIMRCLEWEGQAAPVGEYWGHVPNSSGTDGDTTDPTGSELTSQFAQGQTWLSHTKLPCIVFVLREVSNLNNTQIRASVRDQGAPGDHR